MPSSIPYPDPALPSYPNPYFQDNAFVRGDNVRANNGYIWGNFAYHDGEITTLQNQVAAISASLSIPGFTDITVISNGTSLPIISAGRIEVNGTDVIKTSPYTLLGSDCLGMGYHTVDDYRHIHPIITTSGNPKWCLACGDQISNTTWSSISVTAGVATVTHTAWGVAPVAGDHVIFEGTDFYGVFKIVSITDTTHFIVNTSASNNTYSAGGTMYAQYPASTVQGSSDGVTKTHFIFTDSTASVYSPTPIANTAGTGYYLNQYGRSVATATTYRIPGFSISGASGTIVEIHSYLNGVDKNDNIFNVAGYSNSGSAGSSWTAVDGTADASIRYSPLYSKFNKLWGTDYYLKNNTTYHTLVAVKRKRLSASFYYNSAATGVSTVISKNTTYKTPWFSNTTNLSSISSLHGEIVNSQDIIVPLTNISASGVSSFTGFSGEFK